MQIKTHLVNTIKIAEVTSEKIIIKSIEDGQKLMADLYYQGYDKIVVYAKNIVADFFDLKNGIAGEILQKFSNYRIQLALIGDFSIYQSKSLNAFIAESNRSQHINFVKSLSQALGKSTSED